MSGKALTTAACACLLFGGCSTFHSKKSNEGFTEQDRKFFREAETQFDSPPKAQPGKHPESFMAMGQFYLEMKRYPLAERMFDKAIADDPKCIGAYAGLAKCHSEAGQTQKAADAINKGFAIDPKSPVLWNEAAVLRAKTNDYDGAVEAAEQAVAAAPTIGLYRENLGNLLAVTGRYKKAFEAYSKALSPADAYYRIALVLKDRGDLKGAESHLKQALAQDSAHDASRRMLTAMSSGAPAAQANVQQVSYEADAEREAPVERPTKRKAARTKTSTGSRR
jgi:tetratricopeptide (TPR) repeat protein